MDKAASKKQKPQRAILTFTDEEESKVSMKLVFKPSVKSDALTTPAIQAALSAMLAVVEDVKRQDKKEGANG